jgi:hypothetical protein
VIKKEDEGVEGVEEREKDGEREDGVEKEGEKEGYHVVEKKKEKEKEKEETEQENEGWRSVENRGNLVVGGEGEGDGLDG